MKRCPVCNIEKPLDQFHRCRSRRDGVNSTCIDCRKIKRHNDSKHKTAARRAEALMLLGNEQSCVRCGQAKSLADYTPHATSRTGISKKCRSCIAVAATKERPVTRDARYRHDMALKRLGITRQTYDQMHLRQNGVCAICQRPETRVIRGKLATLCVDHDHATGKIRGLLCGRCNAGLGLLGDTIASIETALSYLKSSTCREVTSPDIERGGD